ncbi:MAG: HU family DNA-binding protein [Syntrophomonadaceae bacterium]
MNKADIVEQMAEALGKSKKDSEKIFNCLMECLTDALVDGEKIQLVGFGTIEVRERQPRKGRNPQSGEVINIPGGRVPSFKPGKALKDAVK